LVKKEDDEYIVKVSDFGLSQKQSSEKPGHTVLPIVIKNLFLVFFSNSKNDNNK